MWAWKENWISFWNKTSILLEWQFIVNCKVFKDKTAEYKIRDILDIGLNGDIVKQ